MAVSADSNWIAAVEYDSTNADYNRVILTSVDGTKKFLLTHDRRSDKRSYFHS